MAEIDRASLLAQDLQELVGWPRSVNKLLALGYVRWLVGAPEEVPPAEYARVVLAWLHQGIQTINSDHRIIGTYGRVFDISAEQVRLSLETLFRLNQKGEDRPDAEARRRYVIHEVFHLTGVTVRYWREKGNGPEYELMLLLAQNLLGGIVKPMPQKAYEVLHEKIELTIGDKRNAVSKKTSLVIRALEDNLMFIHMAISDPDIEADFQALALTGCLSSGTLPRGAGATTFGLVVVPALSRGEIHSLSFVINISSEVAAPPCLYSIGTPNLETSELQVTFKGERPQSCWWFEDRDSEIQILTQDEVVIRMLDEQDPGSLLLSEPYRLQFDNPAVGKLFGLRWAWKRIRDHAVFPAAPRVYPPDPDED